MNIKTKEIMPVVFHLQLETQLGLASTFLRFEEFYESPRFRGKIFTLDVYKRWYTKNSIMGKKTGKFTYYKDWDGFNMPEYVFEPFFDGKFDPLSNKEKQILKLLKDKRGTKFYIIATFNEDHTLNIQHETAHALFHVNPLYKVEALRIVRALPSAVKKNLITYLRLDPAYHESVFEDEMQAILMTESRWLKKFDLWIKDMEPIEKQLQNLFKKYYSKSLTTIK